MAELWMVAVLVVVVVCLLAVLAGAGYSSWPALCAAVYRPATTGYGIVAAQPSRGGKQSSLQSCNVLHPHLASHSTITIL